MNGETPRLQKELGAAAFQKPPDCPREFCVGLQTGREELERLYRVEDELRNALAREEALLGQKDELIAHQDLMRREADHRLMNGLQMVSSLLSLQSREAQDVRTAEQLKIAANRVATIGNVHKRLHALDHVGTVELKQYLEKLCEDLQGVLSGREQRQLSVEGVALEVPTAIGIPLGYIVSELVMNCAKYADSRIMVRLEKKPNDYELSVCDDGPGYPEGFDPKKSKGLGMKIVFSLVHQIGGQAIYGTNHYGRGTCFTVRFALDHHIAPDGN